MPVSDILTFLICALVIAYTYKTLGGESLAQKGEALEEKKKPLFGAR